MLTFKLQIERLLELRQFVDEVASTYAKLKVSPERWQTIEGISRALIEPYKLTMALQQADYKLSEYLGDWIRMKRKLMNMSHRFARDSLNSLEKREQSLLNHKLMLSTVYLDPRLFFVE